MPFRTEGLKAQETEQRIRKQGKENQDRKRIELEQGSRSELAEILCLVCTMLDVINGARRGHMINGAVCELYISVIKLGIARGPSSHPQIAYFL